MKILRLLIILVLFSALIFFNAAAGLITHTLTYNPSNATLTHNDRKIYVNYERDMFFGASNDIFLPYELIFFSVPYNATNFSIRLTVDSIINIPITRRLDTDQESISLGSYVKQPSDSLNFLQSSNPSPQCKIISSGYILGDNQIVKIWFSPFTHHSLTNVLTLITNGSIRLSYDINNSKIPPVARYDLDTKAYDLSLIKPFIVNSSSIMANSYVCNNIIPFVQPSNMPTYNYCIITNRDLEPAFKKIIAMKRQKGLSAGTICIEDLMASTDFNGGDNQGIYHPTITDSAGVVRQYLKYAFQSSTTPTQYVLMGGKAPFAPVRYVYSNVSTDINNCHVSSDMYFSNLSIHWAHKSSSFDQINESEYSINDTISSNYLLNGIYHASFNPDIFVGRLLCSSQKDIENYSDKLHQYVFKPGDGNSSYLSKAIFASFMNDTILNHVIVNNNSALDHMSLFDNSIHQLTGSQFVDYSNNNRCGFLSFHSHGEPQSIQMNEGNNPHYLLTALDRNVVINGNHDEDGNGLDCMLNKKYPFICYSTSCTTTPYDKAQPYCGSTQFEENSYNFGASFTLGKEYGGPAYLGSTRQNYNSEAVYLETDFFRALSYRKMFSLGLSEAFSKVFYLCKEINSQYYNHTILSHNLIGDPEFEMWTSGPQQYTNIEVINRYTSGFLFSGISYNDTISYCDNEGNIGRIYDRSGYVTLFGVSPNSSVMIYNHDHIPYLVPMMLQNCDINNSQYVYASSFSAGRTVVPNIPHGDVTIKNGVVYEIEADDDVLLADGFIVENGATFVIKTHGKVTIDGCVFQSGANVKIEAGKIEMKNKFVAELGAKVVITNFVD